MKTLTFVIPVYNEEQRIGKTIKALKEGFSYSGITLEKVIFVNDGSKDKTVAKIKIQKTKLEAILNAQVEIISYRQNQGKGYAIKQGMLASNSDYTLFFDADMSTPLTEFKKVLPHIETGKDIIIGTRKNGHSTVVKHQPLYRELLGKCFTLLSNIILNTWVTDFTCGFKLFSKYATNEIFTKAKIDRWGYDAELMFIANKLGFPIQEVPLLWANDERSRVNLFKDLPRTLVELFQIRFNGLNIKPSFKTNISLAQNK